MEWVKLGDCFEFIRNGANIKQFDSEGIPITRIETIARGEIDLTKVGYADLHYPSYKDYYLKAGDILMSHINSVTHLGKSALVTKEISTGFIIHGMNLLCLRPKKQQNPLYIKYFFESKVFKRQIYKITKKSVNQASFNIKDLKSLKIPNVTQNDQLRIVKELSCIRNVIAKRREQIDALDALVVSVFNELEKAGGEKVKLKELTKINPQKSEVRELDPNTLVSFVPMEDVSEAGELNLSQGRMLGEVYKGFTYFKDGDVVVAKITPCFENGKGALMKDLVNGIGFGTTEFHVLRSKDLFRLNPIWLFNVTRSKRFNAYGEMQMTGSAGQKRIPKSFLEDYEITLPPIALQNRFADYVTSIEAQKESLRTSLAELETLFDALMQAAFSGHLNLS